MTTDELLTAVRDSATLPSFDEGSDARLLRMLNREQGLWLTKLLTATREEFRTSQLEIAVVTGQLRYDIPTRAIASGLKMIQATDTSGGVWLITELRPSDVPWMRQAWVSPCRRFYLERNQIVFYAQPPAGTITVTYDMRLNRLVTAVGAITVLAVTGATTFTTEGTGGFSAGVKDFIQPEAQFDSLAIDQTVTASGVTGTIAAGVPSRVIAGCYVMPYGTTPVCQAPLELHSLLALRVAYVTLKAKGDPNASALGEELSESTKAAMSLLEPRPTKPRSIVSYTAPGWGTGYYRGGQ